MTKIVFILITFLNFNLMGKTIFDDIFKYNSKQVKTKKEINIVGTWINDSNNLVEFIKEDGYFLGIVKTDINDDNSVFLNGETIIRFKKEKNNIINARVKYLAQSSYKEWKDTKIKLINNTIFDGIHTYKKVLSQKLDNSKLKKKRLNQRNQNLRIQALKQIKSTDDTQKLEGLKILNNLEDRSTVPQIIPLLFDKNKSIKNISYNILLKINKKKEIKGLNNLLNRLKNNKGIENVSLYGYWSGLSKNLKVFIAKNGAMEIIFNNKREMGIHIENNNEIAIQLTTGIQLSVKYKIEGNILILYFPNKKELFLKKDKE